MSLEYFKTLTEYNLWANARISQLILNTGDTAADLEQRSSFPTVRKTMFHIWDAENIWLNRLNGASLSSWPSKDFSGTLAEAINQWHEVSLGFITYLDQVNAELLLDKTIEYKNLKGELFSNKVWEIISHCMNHSTFHRGQLITMLRGAGAEGLESTDMITFYRE